MQTLALDRFDPPRPVSFAAGRTFTGYNAATLAQGGKVTIGAGGSSALAGGTATLTPPPAWAPDGRAVLIANGALAGQLVAADGLTVGAAPPPPAPDCAAEIGKRDAAWRAALARVMP